MAHDDDKPDAGDDPWAGLEADGLPELNEEFSFSFEDEPAESADRSETPEAADAFEDEPAVLAFGDASAAEPVSEGDDAADMFAEIVTAGDNGGPEADGESEADGDSGAAAADEAAIDAWLTDADDAAAASSVFPFDGANESQPDAAESADLVASESRVEIGTGTSGILSPSGIGSLEELAAQPPAEPEAEMFAFAAEPAAADAFPAEAGDTVEDAAADGFVVAAAASQAMPAGEAKPRATTRRPGAQGRKKPSMIGQLVGVVVGGALAIPITLAILIWGFGKDPFGLTPLVPESLSFLVPGKFRPGGDAIDLAGAASLDAVLADTGPAAGDDAEPAASAIPPAATELAADADPTDAEPLGTEPGLPAEPMPSAEPVPPAEPGLGDLAAADPLPAASFDEPGDDPLMDLLDEADAPDAGVAPPVPAEPLEPPPPPEPEPLDLADLEAAVAAVAGRLEGVTSLDDPAAPERRMRLAAWYRDLAGYAEELSNLEALATETGRPFGPAAERAAAVHAAIIEHPDLLEGLAGLTRDWVAYGKRSSDGLVMPATFVAARRVGPYWRCEVTLPAAGRRPAAEMVVLSRAEPAATPGDAVLVTGLVVDDDVVWAADLRPVAVTTEVVPGL